MPEWGSVAAPHGLPGAATAGAPAPLVTIAKSTAARRGEGGENEGEKRVFAHLLRTARQQAAIDVLPGHRVKHCLRTPIKRGTLAYDLYHSPANMRARLAGVQTCGRVWVCAVCAARITEVKRGEVEEAIIAHRLGGGGRPVRDPDGAALVEHGVSAPAG